MWIDKHVPSFRRHPGYGFAAAAAFVVIAALLKLAMPGMQPFLTLYPAVLLSAFIGGRAAGLAALVACTGLAIYFLSTSGSGETTGIWPVAAIIGFILVCAPDPLRRRPSRQIDPAARAREAVIAT